VNLRGWERATEIQIVLSQPRGYLHNDPTKMPVDQNREEMQQADDLPMVVPVPIKNHRNRKDSRCYPYNEQSSAFNQRPLSIQETADLQKASPFFHIKKRA